MTHCRFLLKALAVLYQDWFSWSSFGLAAGDLASAVRGKTVDMGTESGVKFGAQAVGINL